MLPPKQIMQSLWHRKAPWDQPISGETLEKWLVWKSSLPLLGEITVPRCYFSRLEHKGVTFQLQSLETPVAVSVADANSQLEAVDSGNTHTVEQW